MYFVGYRLWNPGLDKCLDIPLTEHPLAANMSKRLKILWNLHDSNFIIFFDPCEQKGPEKYLR